jgi:hypothetical protein
VGRAEAAHVTAAVVVLAATLAAAIGLAVLLGVKLIAAHTAARDAQDFATQAVRERDALSSTVVAHAATILRLEDQLDTVTTQRNTLAKEESTDAREAVATADDPVAAANRVLQALRDRAAGDGPAAANGDGDAEPPALRPDVATDSPAYRRRT